MEMHQIRYFLSVARTLNFTRAAEQCNVSQPALTRAIRQLEEELSGELLRREGKNSHLTDLGQRMVPLMQRCYESALAAKSLASSFKKGATHVLTLVLSHSIDMGLMAAPLAEIQRNFPGLQMTILRGNAGEISEALQKGKAEFAVAGPLGQQSWERLDAWPLFEEKFELAVPPLHGFARAGEIGAQDLAGQQILLSTQCESAEGLAQVLEEQGLGAGNGHQIGTMHDVLALLDANLGIAFLPQTAVRRGDLHRVSVAGVEMSRQVSLYGVAGRQRSVAGDAIMKLLRARDWSENLS
jgi:DNA-binding transcriptional LysR family regulator